MKFCYCRVYQHVYLPSWGNPSTFPATSSIGRGWEVARLASPANVVFLAPNIFVCPLILSYMQYFVSISDMNQSFSLQPMGTQVTCWSNQRTGFASGSRLLPFLISLSTQVWTHMLWYGKCSHQPLSYKWRHYNFCVFCVYVLHQPFSYWCWNWPVGMLWFPQPKGVSSIFVMHQPLSYRCKARPVHSMRRHALHLCLSPAHAL